MQLDKSSSPGSAGEGATPAGMPSARLPASSPPAEALLDPKGFDLTVAAIKPSAVDSPHGLSTTQPLFDARTGIQSHVPAEDVTGFSTGGMEALQEIFAGVAGHVLWDTGFGVMYERVIVMDGDGTVSVPVMPQPLPLTMTVSSVVRLEGP